MRPIAFAASLLLPAMALAAPSGWRGDGSGRYPDAMPPLRVGPTKNVAWITPLPPWGNSTPAIAGDRIFVTIEPTTVACLSARDGRVLWKRAVSWIDTLPAAELPAARKKADEARALAAELDAASKELDKLRRDARKKGVGPEAKARLEELGKRVAEMKGRYAETAKYRAPEDIPTVGNASPTPVTDGKNVWAYFGNHVVASLGDGGNLRWARYLPPASEQAMHGFTHGRSASPLLVGKRLIVPLNRLHALDADTGRTLWTGDDYLDYGTPALARIGDADVVLTPDGRAVRAADGTVLAKGLPFIFYVGPAVGEGVAFWAGNTESSPPNRAQVTAVRLPAGPQPFETKTLWTRALPNERQYATPLVSDGHVFTIDERGHLTIVDAATGAVLAARDFAVGAPFASPTLAGRYVFIGGSDGKLAVIEAKPPFRDVATNEIEPFRASPVFVGKRLYLRTLEKLYCFEER